MSKKLECKVCGEKHVLSKWNVIEKPHMTVACPDCGYLKKVKT